MGGRLRYFKNIYVINFAAVPLIVLMIFVARVFPVRIQNILSAILVVSYILLMLYNLLLKFRQTFRSGFRGVLFIFKTELIMLLIFAALLAVTKAQYIKGTTLAVFAIYTAVFYYNSVINFYIDFARCTEEPCPGCHETGVMETVIDYRKSERLIKVCTKCGYIKNKE